MKKLPFICTLFSFFIVSQILKAQKQEFVPVINYGSPIVQINQYMPDTILQDTLKQEHTLSEYLGKYILLYFWGVSCGPCNRGLPELQEIYENNKDKLTVVAINTDLYRYSFRKGTEAKKMIWPSLWDNGTGFKGIAARYEVTGVPSFIWISPEGIVLDKWSGYGTGSTKRKMDELLKNIRPDKVSKD